VSDADQAPLALDFFQSSEHKPTEPHVVLEVAEDGFIFDTPLMAQSQTLLREQIVSGLLAIAMQCETELHAAIALGLGALRFKRTGGTIPTFINAALGEIAVLGFVGSGFEVDQAVVGRADEFILVRVIRKVGRLEAQCFE